MGLSQISSPDQLTLDVGIKIEDKALLMKLPRPFLLALTQSHIFWPLLKNIFLSKLSRHPRLDPVELCPSNLLDFIPEKDESQKASHLLSVLCFLPIFFENPLNCFLYFVI